MMGGQIEVSSKLHKGSKFTVKLSFELDKNEQGLEVTDIEDVDINGMRILLVEDNELNREIAMEVLKEEGAYVDVAVDGKEALDIFTMSKQGAYEAIIMDVMMPNMDGITATRHIRSSEHKDAISIPIIAMTANAFEEDIKKTKEAGMNAHISKPLNPTVLFSELMRIKREKSREECIV
jgi:CheY-like chemotaxis protein